MIGIVVAMEKEARHFLIEADIQKERQIAKKKIYEGSFKNYPFVLIISGIGKVNAGMATQILIDNFNLDKVINFGSAGGKDPKTQKVGDVALIDKVCQYDFDLSEIDDVNVGYMQDFDLTYFETSYKKYKGNSFVISTLASADKFSTKKETLDTLIQLGANVSDMEAGAIAQVAYSNEIDFYILKLLTDVEGGSAESIFTQYVNNIKEICSKIPNAVYELLQNI